MPPYFYMFTKEPGKSDTHQEAIGVTPSSCVRAAWRDFRPAPLQAPLPQQMNMLSRNSALTVQNVTLRQVPSGPYSNLLAQPSSLDRNPGSSLCLPEAYLFTLP